MNATRVCWTRILRFLSSNGKYEQNGAHKCTTWEWYPAAVFGMRLYFTSNESMAAMKRSMRAAVGGREHDIINENEKHVRHTCRAP